MYSFSTIGWFHLVCAIMAMLTGLIVVLNKKGTQFHKRIGYTYVTLMLVLNISSFFISNFGGFSIFHFFAIVSLMSIFGGMYTVLVKKPNWIYGHYYAMSWSVVGLYCAFWAELGTRFVKNMQEFWWVVALATLLTSVIGHLIIKKEVKKI